jgi:predicted nucleotidyltransferase component of viral defense system
MHLEVLTREGCDLFARLTAFRDFYLAGGTALALQIGHRVSVDFDFFSDKPIRRTLLPAVERVFEGTIQPVIDNRSELTVLAGSVKVSFIAYPFPLLDPLVSLGSVRSLSIREIAATKAYTIGRRGAYKDYVDLYFVLKDHHTSLEETIVMAERKFGAHFNSRLFLEQLLFMGDITDYAIDFVHAAPTPSEILEFFTDEIAGLPLAA